MVREKTENSPESEAEVEMIVRIEDVRASGYCVKGLREKLQLLGFDLKEFVRHGLPYEMVSRKAGNDDQVKRVLKACKRRYGRR